MAQTAWPGFLLARPGKNWYNKKQDQGRGKEGPAAHEAQADPRAMRVGEQGVFAGANSGVLLRGEAGFGGRNARRKKEEDG